MVHMHIIPETESVRSHFVGTGLESGRMKRKMIIMVFPDCERTEDRRENSFQIPFTDDFSSYK